MKETQVLFKHNITRMIRRHWYYRGRVKIFNTTAEELLRSRGLEVTDIKKFLNPPREPLKLKVTGLYDIEPKKDKSHPDYNSEPCLIFSDENVPVLGLDQAKVLTNTVEISKGLPETVVENEKKLNLPDELHSQVIRKVKLSCLLEATQLKLPKLKDPARPAWVFPRIFGINDSRKNELLCKNLAMICEQFAGNLNNKSVILDAFFSTPVKAHNKLMQFELTSELLITTKKKPEIFAEPESTHAFPLPHLYPVNCTVGLRPHHFYVMQNIYPVSHQSKWPYIQLAFLHRNESQVRNLSGEIVTDNQVQGRSLLKGFSMAVAQARALYGSDIKELPEPIVVPIVQTDGKMFHFAIFQLNTLALDSNTQDKNIFWNSEQMPLYQSCEYQCGRPVLKDYNQDIIRKLITFYNIE